MENIKRREALRRTAWLMGGALTAPSIAGILGGCRPDPKLTWAPTFFSEEEARLVMEASERILPETDTPGAKSLGVPRFIEEMVSLYYDPADRARFMEGLKEFQEKCKSDYGDVFIALDREDQLKVLYFYNNVLRIPGEGSGRLAGANLFFRSVKELTLVGYYTTEYGATQALQYQAIPVEYHGCVPLEEAGNGKTWAT